MRSGRMEHPRAEIDRHFRSALARAVRELIAESSLNYNQLAGMSGLSRITIRKVEHCDHRGGVLPSGNTVVSLLFALDVTALEFTRRLHDKVAEQSGTRDFERQSTRLRTEVEGQAVEVQVTLSRETKDDQ